MSTQFPPSRLAADIIADRIGWNLTTGALRVIPGQPNEELEERQNTVTDLLALVRGVRLYNAFIDNRLDRIWTDIRANQQLTDLLINGTIELKLALPWEPMPIEFDDVINGLARAYGCFIPSTDTSLYVVTDADFLERMPSWETVEVALTANPWLVTVLLLEPVLSKF